MQVSGSNMISIHALREEGDPIPRYFDKKYESISIHALREEGDLVSTHHRQTHDISIHALREEGDRDLDVHDFVVGRFLSTPSARRATSFWPQYSRYSQFLSTPSARRATDCPRLDNTRHKFLSTPSARRATDKRGLTQRAVAISIHALREEGDHVQSFAGEGIEEFLSTPSARRATFASFISSFRSGFLSTPSARRATSWRQTGCFLPQKFLSTPSARRATTKGMDAATPSLISIHALREEGD